MAYRVWKLLHAENCRVLSCFCAEYRAQLVKVLIAFWSQVARIE